MTDGERRPSGAPEVGEGGQEWVDERAIDGGRRPAGDSVIEAGMKIYVVLCHADNYGREVCGVYSTKKKAKRAVLAIALDDTQRYEQHHIAEVEVDTDTEIEWHGPGSPRQV